VRSDVIGPGDLQRLRSSRLHLPTLEATQLPEGQSGGQADCIDLQTQAKQAHWNVKGPQCIAQHAG
jgi:starvation-inducible DNA-binding protein